MTNYINNLVYQELIDQDQYDSNKRNERIYLDLRARSGYTEEAKMLERNNSKINVGMTLKNAASKKDMGLFVG